MNVHATPIAGVFILDAPMNRDERGGFQRLFCMETLKKSGVAFPVIQANLSTNAKAGTLRGVHYQDAPKPDPKIVRCLKGRMFDVAVDIRQGSPTFRQWVGIELTPEKGNALVIPGGCAHGFVTLEDNTEILYLMGEAYAGELARGVRWNDPAFKIAWPMQPAVIAERDANYPDFTG
ncbi:MAG: dTDP-4-dehydrorhamnose 3,5-epimerase [Alphaproteobacteria bacterium]|nr:dTDP-4-dehydrorhamnose 3,5-epimerase [Alphaproteobacteria bacterium]